MSKFHEALFIFQLGAVDSTVDCLVRESTSTSDGGGQTLSGKTATQLTASDDNKIVMISVKSEELSNGYRYLRGRMTVGNGTTITSRDSLPSAFGPTLILICMPAVFSKKL